MGAKAGLPLEWESDETSLGATWASRDGARRMPDLPLGRVAELLGTCIGASQTCES